jgi:glutathione reductase (NADPH)
LTVYINGGKIEDVSKLIWCIGRNPSTPSLNLDKVGVKVDAFGHIKVDEYQNTTAPGIYALGDVCGRFLLTPGTTFNTETNSRF